MNDDRFDRFGGCNLGCGSRLLLLDRCNGSLKTKLQLGLSSADESLEDLWVVWVERDKAARGVGEALEDDGLLRLDGEDVAELESDRVSSDRSSNEGDTALQPSL